MKFGIHGTLEVSQTGSSFDCGFGMNVTADGSYKLEKRTPKARSATVVPGAPSQEECASLQPASAPAGNQLALNQAAADEATREGCRMRIAYERLNGSLSSKPGANGKLALAQEAWSALFAAHENERFPHQGEQGHYGSMLGMCVAGVNQGMYRTRAAELRSFRPCSDDVATDEQARDAAHRAEVALTDAVRTMKTKYSKDPELVAALMQAQSAFKNVRRSPRRLRERGQRRQRRVRSARDRTGNHGARGRG